jgi:hypothetical protein
LRNYWIDISGVVSWLINHYTRTNMPTGQVRLQKQLFSRLFTDWKKSLDHKEIALGAFMDIEGALDNTSFQAITTAARERELGRPVAGGSVPSSKAD